MSIANDELLRDTLRENDRLRAKVDGYRAAMEFICDHGMSSTKEALVRTAEEALRGGEEG